MKRKYITIKLFCIIAAVLTLFLGIVLVLQTKYFGAYYSNFKKNQFAAAVEYARKYYDHIAADEELLYSKLNYLDKEYNCSAALYPVNDVQYIQNKTKSAASTGIYITDNSDANDLLFKATIKYLAEHSNSEEPTIQTLQSGNSNLNYLVSFQIVTINDERYILAMASSLQSLDEAMGTLGNISWLVYLCGFLLSLLLSAIIAKLVAIPLIREIEREKALDNMRKDFIANTSHEMKTPISIISGYAESLMDGILTPEERTEYEYTIYDESQKMGKLVCDMLEIAMLQNDKYELKKSNVLLDKLIKKTLNRLSIKMKAKHISVAVDKVSQVSAFVDENAIETVLINFISNAISHTAEHGKIRIALVQNNKKAHFEIENEGLPIPEDAFVHIWESFYRVDKSHNREDGRFGLGLFAVKTIIEKHNGTVSASNTEAGVLFCFDIPV